MNRITMCIEEGFSGKVIGSFDLTEYGEKVRAEVIEEVYDRIDEGVCLMCEHRHEDYKCINDCNKNGWERETIMKWLKEQK